MAYTKQNWSNGSAGGTPVSAERLNYMETGIETAQATADAAGGAGGGDVTAQMLGRIFLDSYAGANDDAKLDAALAAANVTYPPTITFGNRQTPYSFATANRVAREALRLGGPFGFGNPERNGQTKMPARVNLTMTGGWWQPPAATFFGMSMHNFSFVGGSNARVLDQGSSTASWGNLLMRDIYSSGLRNLIGSQTAKVLLLASVFDGAWQIHNTYNGHIHIGGSDNQLWTGGYLQIDSGVSFATSGSATGQYHLWFDYLEKTDVGRMYMTAEGPWAGIRVTGPANPSTSGGGNLGGPLVIHNSAIEGRNAGQPCDGSLIRVEGGIVTIRDSWLGYAMQDPAAQGHSPQDAGVIHHSGGHLLVDGVTYDRATGIAETVPFVYQATSTLRTRVFNVFTGSKGGSWSGLPRVDEAAASSIVKDDTTTAI